MSNRKTSIDTGRARRQPESVSGARSREGTFSTRAIFLHPWDLMDEGADHVMSWISGAGLNEMVLAGCYHSGWFIHPHNPRHRTFMTEGSVAYFHPDSKIFKGSPLRPTVAGMARKTNWLDLAGMKLAKHGLRMVSWTIGAHNTRLALRHPQFAQQTVYGDALPHALSIGHEATRCYLKALCRDLAANYPLYGIQLESFGWMTVRHGHHHERDLTDLKPFEQELLAVCFNPQTVRKAQKEGVDVARARKVVKATLDTAFREAPDRPKGHPRSMAELEATEPALGEYNRFLSRLAHSMVTEIKQESLKGTGCKLFVQEGYQKEIAKAVDGFASWVYGKSPQQVLRIVRQGRSRIPQEWDGSYPSFVRLGMGVPSDRQQLREILVALKAGGSTGPIFYNYSEAPPKMLGWISEALRGL